MNKTVIVCGGSKGIGCAIVEKLLETNEYKVVYISRSPSAIKHPKLNYYKCDLSNRSERADVFKTMSPLDPWAIINNAGGPLPGSVIESNTNKLQDAIELHLYASQDLINVFLDKMAQRRSGRIINVISVTAKIPLENLLASNTVRGAMLNWSKTLSRELGRYNITVNNILPGYTNTERLTEVILEASKKQGIAKSEIEANLLKQIPLGRFGDPKEIAALAKFLLSDDASFISGASIPVDGGWTQCT